MGSISAEVKARMEQVASQVIPSMSSTWVSDLADRLLDRFPQLKTAQAASLGEVVTIVAPWFKAVGIATVTALVILQIGAAGLALSSTVLLNLAVFAIGLYLIYKVGPGGVSKKLEELFESIKLQFLVSAITYDDFSNGFRTVSLCSLNRTAIA